MFVSRLGVAGNADCDFRGLVSIDLAREGTDGWDGNLELSEEMTTYDGDWAILALLAFL